MALDHALRHSVGVRAVHSDDDAAGTGLRIGAWSAHGGDSPERRRGCAVPVAGLRAGAPVPLAILLPDLVAHPQVRRCAPTDSTLRRIRGAVRPSFRMPLDLCRQTLANR